MSKSRDIADSAATINYIDGLTSDAQGQIDTATSDIATNASDIATKAPLSNPTFTGTVTATAFSGDGSGLTGVDSLPDQTGNAGSYLTTDGTDASWAALEVGTATMTASGSITAGDPVALNSDGTVSRISTTTENASGWNNGVNVNGNYLMQVGNVAQSTSNSSPFVASNGEYFVCFEAPVFTAASSFSMAIRSVRLYKLVDGMPVHLDTVQSESSSACHHVGIDISYDSKYVALATMTPSSTDYLEIWEIKDDALVGVYSAQNDSLHSSAVKFSHNSYDLCVVMDNGSSYFICTKYTFSAGNWSQASTTPSISFGTDKGNLSVERVPNTNKIVLYCGNNRNNSYPSAVVYNMDTNSFGTITVFATTNNSNNWGGMVTDGNGAFYAVYNNFNSGDKLSIRKFSISGNNLSLSTLSENAIANWSSSYGVSVCYHRKSDKITVTYYDFGLYKYAAALYDVSSGISRISLTYDSPMKNQSYRLNTSSATSNSFSGFEGTDLSLTNLKKYQYGWLVFYPLRITSTNIDQFVGYATESITSGSSGVIKLKGSTYDTSGLTAGTTYYLDLDGSLVTKSQVTRKKTKIGRALSTTKLLLEA